MLFRSAEAKEKNLVLIDPEINIFDYLAIVDLVITTKLTSVGLIAESLKIPTIYVEHPSYAHNFSDSDIYFYDEFSLSERLLHILKSPKFSRDIKE